LNPNLFNGARRNNCASLQYVLLLMAHLIGDMSETDTNIPLRSRQRRFLNSTV
jgi:hypothetical protein